MNSDFFLKYNYTLLLNINVIGTAWPGRVIQKHIPFGNHKSLIVNVLVASKSCEPLICPLYVVVVNSFEQYNFYVDVGNAMERTFTLESVKLQNDR